MRRLHAALLAALLLLPASCGQAADDDQPGPKSPQESLAALKVRPGFTAQLAAAEPLVMDPIALAWGPDSRLWVVEMGDYPLGAGKPGAPGGRVRVLEDTDGDGLPDKSTLFLDGLFYPTGVLPWRKGALVTCAPDLLYAEDTDGDGKCDRKEVLYTGFVQGNQQHRVNGPTLGLDNWVYLANGDSGGRVKSLKTGQEVDIRGRDLRIRPDDGALEAVTGQTQYGRARDDWGSWFGGNNANPLWHFVLEERYLRRNPHVAPPDPRVNVPTVPGTAPVFPASRLLPRFNDFHTANRFTSACSPVLYRDDLFGPAFAGNVFICEPVHNLVHREVMTPAGPTFTSRRAPDEQQSEFLASADNWCRPVMARVGPDGALWVADMYRHVIEHPEWIPREWQKKLDLRAGHDKGRLCRVFPTDRPPRPLPRLDRFDTPGLVAALDSPSGWQRDLAQFMLAWQADPAAAPLLEKLARACPRPETRACALAALDGLRRLSPEPLAHALRDPHPGVRRHAVLLAEPRLASVPLLADPVLALVADPDPAVRLQLACTLGEWPDPRAARALGRLARKDGADRYHLAAILSSITKDNLSAVMLAALQPDTAPSSPPPPTVLESLLRLASVLGDTRSLSSLLGSLALPARETPAPWHYVALASLLDGLDARNGSLARLAEDPALAPAVQALAPLFDAARRDAAAPAADLDRRLPAVRLLGRGLDRQPDDARALAALLAPRTPPAVQSEAVAALGRLRDPAIPALMLTGWKAHSPSLRADILNTLSRRDEGLRVLLDAVAAGRIPAAEIDAPRRQRLLEHRDKSLRDRAAALLAAPAGGPSGDRQKVLDAYASVTRLPADPARGKPLFVKACSACHRLAGAGNEVGPDLAALAGKPVDYLLTAVLDPNRAVEARYVNYLAELKNGLNLTGVLAAETATSITLVGPDGKPATVLRTDLESLESSGKSAMPEGLEKDLSPQALADVLAFVKSSAPPAVPKSFPGNRPETVTVEPGGSLKLAASQAAIFGPTLVFEPRYANLGYWSSPADRAQWTVRVPKAGSYAAWLDYACAADAAGNRYVLEAAGRELKGEVAATGTWDDYKQVKAGTLTLPAGEITVELRPDGPPRTALLDLRLLRLVPAEK